MISANRLTWFWVLGFCSALRLALLNGVWCVGKDEICVENYSDCINEPEFQRCKPMPFTPFANLTIVPRTDENTVTLRCLDYNHMNSNYFVPGFDWVKWNRTQVDSNGRLDIDNGSFTHIEDDSSKYSFRVGTHRQDIHAQWLTINHLNSADYGLYTCVTCTKYGRSYQSVLLVKQQPKQSVPTTSTVLSESIPTTLNYQSKPAAIPSTNRKTASKIQWTTIALLVVGSVLVLLIVLGVLFALRSRIFKEAASSPACPSSPRDPFKQDISCKENRKSSSTTSFVSQQTGSSISSMAPLVKYRNSNAARGTNSGQMTYISELTDDEDVFEAEIDEMWEITREHVVIRERIGEGAFGFVMKATAYGLPDKPPACTVAVKILREDATNKEMLDFIAEIETMKNIGNHTNIINLVGTCTINGPILLVVEFALHGNLRDFLRKHRCPFTTEVSHNNNLHIKQEDSLAIGTLISFAYQAAKGMEYLASKKCIHRDLAARNVLVAEDYAIKLADFGLSRNLQETDYYRKTTHGRIPIMWLSIEALFDQKYTLMSDVWSFGVLMWEIFTMGSSPYPGIQIENIFTVLKSGYRMPIPQICPPEIYTLMLQCWSEKVNDRPTMGNISEELDTMLASSSNVEYLNIIEHSTDNLSPDNSEGKQDRLINQNDGAETHV